MDTGPSGSNSDRQSASTQFASASGGPARQYTPVVHAGEEGYYEPASDAHLYDLMGGPLGELEDPGPQESADVLVVTAAWLVPAPVRGSVERWLAQRLKEPEAWLTPWRQGEPAIQAALWLDVSDAAESAPYLVVRLDNSYIPRGTLRASMDAALGRFDDLRTAVESTLVSPSGAGLELCLPRATRSWMDSSAYLANQLAAGIDPTARVMDGAVLVGPSIQIGAGCVIEPGAFIRGPVILGRDCEVRHGAYLRGDIIAGDGCVFGHTSEFKNAILLDGAKGPHFNYVGDSILGRNVNMGAGSKLSNLKVTAGNVVVYASEERIDSGLRKFGAILGDGAEIGCNAVLNPGTVLAPGCIVYPNASTRGYYPPNTVIKLRQQLEHGRRRVKE
ncbi:MAG: hypothetical protein LC772_10695 [Chloroflexi bacterium]|nr:hypothetical protein [Chloroflexota bacterium]